MYSFVDQYRIFLIKSFICKNKVFLYFLFNIITINHLSISKYLFSRQLTKFHYLLAINFIATNAPKTVPLADPGWLPRQSPSICWASPLFPAALHHPTPGLMVRLHQDCQHSTLHLPHLPPSLGQRPKNHLYYWTSFPRCYRSLRAPRRLLDHLRMGTICSYQLARGSLSDSL